MNFLGGGGDWSFPAGSSTAPYYRAVQDTQVSKDHIRQVLHRWTTGKAPVKIQLQDRVYDGTIEDFVDRFRGKAETSSHGHYTTYNAGQFFVVGQVLEKKMPAEQLNALIHHANSKHFCKLPNILKNIRQRWEYDSNAFSGFINKETRKERIMMEHIPAYVATTLLCHPTPHALDPDLLTRLVTGNQGRHEVNRLGVETFIDMFVQAPMPPAQDPISARELFDLMKNELQLRHETEMVQSKERVTLGVAASNERTSQNQNHHDFLMSHLQHTSAESQRRHESSDVLLAQSQHASAESQRRHQSEMAASNERTYRDVLLAQSQHASPESQRRHQSEMAASNERTYLDVLLAQSQHASAESQRYHEERMVAGLRRDTEAQPATDVQLLIAEAEADFQALGDQINEESREDDDDEEEELKDPPTHALLDGKLYSLIPVAVTPSPPPNSVLKLDNVLIRGEESRKRPVPTNHDDDDDDDDNNNMTDSNTSSSASPNSTNHHDVDDETNSHIAKSKKSKKNHNSNSMSCEDRTFNQQQEYHVEDELSPSPQEEGMSCDTSPESGGGDTAISEGGGDGRKSTFVPTTMAGDRVEDHQVSTACTTSTTATTATGMGEVLVGGSAASSSITTTTSSTPANAGAAAATSVPGNPRVTFRPISSIPVATSGIGTKMNSQASLAGVAMASGTSGSGHSGEASTTQATKNKNAHESFKSLDSTTSTSQSCGLPHQQPQPQPNGEKTTSSALSFRSSQSNAEVTAGVASVDKTTAEKMWREKGLNPAADSLVQDADGVGNFEEESLLEHHPAAATSASDADEPLNDTDDDSGVKAVSLVYDVDVAGEPATSRSTTNGSFLTWFDADCIPNIDSSVDSDEDQCLDGDKMYFDVEEVDPPPCVAHARKAKRARRLAQQCPPQLDGELEDRMAEERNGVEKAGKAVTMPASSSSNDLPPGVEKMLDDLLERVFSKDKSASTAATRKQCDEEGEKWFNGLPDEARNILSEGIEAMIHGALQLAAARTFDKLVREKAAASEEAGDDGDRDHDHVEDSAANSHRMKSSFDGKEEDTNNVKGDEIDCMNEEQSLPTFAVSSAASDCESSWQLFDITDFNTELDGDFGCESDDEVQTEDTGRAIVVHGDGAQVPSDDEPAQEETRTEDTGLADVAQGDGARVHAIAQKNVD